MANFIKIKPFYPTSRPYGTEAKHDTYWINIDHIYKVWKYDPEIHATIKEERDGTRTPIIPEGALDSIFISLAGQSSSYQLDVESSKKVMAAICAE